jgi:hypothetical protein
MFPLSRRTDTPVWSLPRLRRAPAAPDPRSARELVNVEYVFTRAELQPVLSGIRTSLGCGEVALDSPHRLQDALTTLIREANGRADVSVRRSPAALLTPEYWQIVLTGLDDPTHVILRELFAAGRP